MSDCAILESLTLETKTGDKIGIDAVKQNLKFVLLYFSAHWCPPCRKFTPILKEFYEEVNDENKQVEIIFISSDKSSEEHQKYFSEEHGDWLTVPFQAEDLREELRNSLGKKLNAEGELVRSGIPCLVVVSGDLTRIVTFDGVSDLTTLGSMAFEMKWK